MSNPPSPGGALSAANRRPLLSSGIGLAACIALIALAAACGGGDGAAQGTPDGTPRGTPTPRDTPVSAGLLTVTPAVEGTIDPNRPTREDAGHLESLGDEDRFVIPSINVDAPLTYRRVVSDGAGGASMPNPEGPDDIAYYDFSAIPGKGGAPGMGGNAVFAGHVDSGHIACDNGTEEPPCTAVLWDLNMLGTGDVIEVHLDGVVHTYAVTSNQPVEATENFTHIVASTAVETITIITCGGDFNRETGQYRFRQVVTAERVS